MRGSCLGVGGGPAVWRHVRATKRSCRLAGGLVRGGGESAPEPAAVVNRQGFSVAPTIRSVQALLAEPVGGQQAGPPGHDPDPPDGGADSDKASVYSETDSGVVVASRPTSYVSSPETTVNNEGGDGQPAAGQQQGVRCPVCHKVSALGPGAAADLPRYTAMSRIIARQRGDPSLGEASASTSAPTGTPATLPPCQLCEGPPRAATTECQQCQVLYCGPCLTSCHPPRGPLATHTLGSVAPLGGSIPGAGEVCAAHGERPSLYCLVCRWSGCRECGPGHSQHDLQPLDNLAKTHKVSVAALLYSHALRFFLSSLASTLPHSPFTLAYYDHLAPHITTASYDITTTTHHLLRPPRTTYNLHAAHHRNPDHSTLSCAPPPLRHHPTPALTAHAAPPTSSGRENPSSTSSSPCRGRRGF
ncbi:Tripartite motif-containing protein 9 [Penaeus vannamei]|uniref:Tripartite motif-containing protein 9 n=1 Tax=Penaeus vannamei TaxID=6689 RepID=A0A3R7PEV1_PENVA|nr:Tripartite motif-containing protein 9 [Penaeus vannamei]